MHNLRLRMPDRPGALAEFGEALGAAAVSLEGGGVFWTGAMAMANFLVADGHAARAALERAGLPVDAVEDVVLLRLDQARPGQLGLVARRMAAAGVNIRTQYSDHDHRLVLVVDDREAAEAVVRSIPGMSALASASQSPGEVGPQAGSLRLLPS